LCSGCHASSIPQLPEEIILHIFEYLRLDLYDDRSFFDQAPGASNCIVLNKRFYAFLRPSWFSSLLASTAASNLLAVALRRPQDYNCITAINLVFYLETPSYTEFADLCRLPNLRKISVALEKRSADTSNFDGSKLLKPLEKLKDLTHLEITSQFGIRFTSCTWERGVTSNSFIKIAPRLTSLHLSFPQMTDLYLALRKSPGTLRRLALTFQSCRDWWAIPWATLEDLTFSGSSMGMKQELCKAFKDALYPARVVRSRDLPSRTLAADFSSCVTYSLIMNSLFRNPSHFVDYTSTSTSIPLPKNVSISLIYATFSTSSYRPRSRPWS